jgi:hypothetical protein
VRLYNPWPEPYTVNPGSPYGPRRDPITGAANSWHHGIDVAMPIGTKLIAAADGTIAHKGSGASGGYTLIIRHEGNWHTVYYHLQYPSHLNIGDRVSAGDIVASSGNTGRSTGPHLHFELRRSKTWGDTVDPVPYLQGHFRVPVASRPEPVADSVEPVRSTPTVSTPPNRSGRAAPGLEAWSNSWIARGAHFLRMRGLQ